MEQPSQHTKSIYYPPGGILLWMIAFLELITFGIALVVMTVYSRQEPELFHQSRLQLNTILGTLNTGFLLSSGFFMAMASRRFREQNFSKTAFFLKLSILFGLLFVLFKGIEYTEKINAGIGFSTNLFYSFYWSLTIFHLGHVGAGLVILSIFLLKVLKKQFPSPEDFEAGAAFWHLCDLIWLLIFPVLYLLF